MDQTELDLDALLRRAAAWGPGWRGRRTQADDAERGALADAIREAGAAPPPYLERLFEWIDREAVLFRTGDYPDKGVTVRAEQLAALEAGYNLPVPVLIEHADSPLEIGYLTDVRVDGEELRGTVALTTEAHALIERSGAQALSLGLAPDLGAIREVSLVRHPRVAGARLFHRGQNFEGRLVSPPECGATDWQARYEALRAEHRRAEADALVASYVRQGKLSPAQAPMARALLEHQDAIHFDGETAPVAQLVQTLIERAPTHMLLQEQVPDLPIDDAAHLLLPEEADFYRRHFPDIQLDQIARRKSAGFGGA